MKVAILGAGHGGCAMAADLVLVDPLNPGRVEKVLLGGRLVFDGAVRPTV